MQSLMNIGILAQVKTKNHVVKIICEKPNTSLLCTKIILRKGIKKYKKYWEKVNIAID